MPTYRITAPDGHTYQITAPEGATEAEVLAYAQKNAPAAKAPVSAQQANIDQMGGVDKLMVGVGRGFNDVGQGLTQASKQTQEWAAGLPGPMRALMTASALPLRMISGDDGKQSAADYTKQVEAELADYEPLRQDSPVLTGVGRLVGNVAATPIPGGAGATLGARVGSGAAAGALQGAVQFTPEDGSRGFNAAVGAAVGGVLPAVLKAGTVTVGAVKDLGKKFASLMPAVSQEGREQIAARVLKEAVSNSDNLLKIAGNTPLVQGTKQTLAEVTDDRGIAALQNTLANQSSDFKNQLGELAQGNNAARVEAIRKAFGGATEASAEAIEAQRDKVAIPLLNRAQEVTGVNTKPVTQLADRIIRARDGSPSIQRAVSWARDLLVRGVSPQDRGKNAVQAILEAKGRRMSGADFKAVDEAAKIARRVAAGTITPDEGAAALKAMKPSSAAAARAVKAGRDLLSSETRNVDDIHRLYNTRKEIGYMLSGKYGNDSDAAMAASRELLAVRGALDNQMRKVSPEFYDYLTKFRDMSKEAGRVRMGAELLTKSFSARDAAGNPVISPAQFARAADDLDRVAAKATGFRKATAENLMTPNQKGVVGAIRADLDRVARTNQAGTAIGSNTAQNLERLGALRSSATGVEDDVRSAALSAVPFAGKALDRFNQYYGRKVISILEEATLNPARAQQLLAKLSPAQQQQVAAAMRDPALMKALQSMAPVTASAAVTGE
jgi:hypothetical protein